MSRQMNIAETRANILEFMATHSDDETNDRLVEEGAIVYQAWLDLAWPLVAALCQEEEQPTKDNGDPASVEGRLLRMVSLELLSQWVDLFKAMRAIRALHKELLPEHYQRQVERGRDAAKDSEAWIATILGHTKEGT